MSVNKSANNKVKLRNLVHKSKRKNELEKKKIQNHERERENPIF